MRRFMVPFVYSTGRRFSRNRSKLLEIPRSLSGGYLKAKRFLLCVPNYPGSLKCRISHTHKCPPQQQLRSSRPVYRSLMTGSGQEDRTLRRFRGLIRQNP
jgi:hypothetical protein